MPKQQQQQQLRIQIAVIRSQPFESSENIVQHFGWKKVEYIMEWTESAICRVYPSRLLPWRRASQQKINRNKIYLNICSHYSCHKNRSAVCVVRMHREREKKNIKPYIRVSSLRCRENGEKRDTTTEKKNEKQKSSKVVHNAVESMSHHPNDCLHFYQQWETTAAAWLRTGE